MEDGIDKLIQDDIGRESRMVLEEFAQEVECVEAVC